MSRVAVTWSRFARALSSLSSSAVPRLPERLFEVSLVVGARRMDEYDVSDRQRAVLVLTHRQNGDQFGKSLKGTVRSHYKHVARTPLHAVLLIESGEIDARSLGHIFSGCIGHYSISYLLEPDRKRS